MGVDFVPTSPPGLNCLPPSAHQVPDGDFPLHVVKPGHWSSYLSVCGWSSMVSVGVMGQGRG